MEGCYRRSSVHAVQCKRSRLAFFLPELHAAALPSSAHVHADSAGINHPYRKRRMIKQASINASVITSSA